MNRDTQATDGKCVAQQTGYEGLDRFRPSDSTTGILWVVIPYTTPELTRAALRHAGVCSDLRVHVALVDIQVVPYPCPLDQPPINKEFSKRRLQELFKESGLPGQAAVLYTRDWLETFKKAFEPTSLVILASKKWRWWPTREEKLTRALNEAGHQAMLLPVVR